MPAAVRACAASVLLALLVTPFAAGQQTLGAFEDVKELPDTPAARAAREVVEVVNSGDPERVRKLVNERFTEEFRGFAPLEEHLDVFATVKRVNEELEIVAWRKYADARPAGEIVLICRSKALEQWRGVIVQVEEAAPHRIAGLNFAPARPPSFAEPAPALSEAQLSEELLRFVERQAAADRFSGAVLVARDGRVLVRHAVGEANKSDGVPNRVDTRFNLGSMNKMITAVAVAQLVERGKLRFDDPVSKHLTSEWIDPQVGQKITVAHLLSHTSGLGSHFTEEFWNASRMRYRNLEDYQALLRAQTPAFEPGTQWQYSNAGFLLLGALIQKVSGQSYDAYIAEHVAAPAGMKDTVCYEMDKVVPRLAIGYSRERGADGAEHWESNVFKHAIKGGAAGGGYSTVDDLLAFDRALRDGKLVSAATRDRLWTSTPPADGYGYGFGVQRGPAGLVVGHTGGFPGISAALDIYVDRGFTVAVLSNYSEAAIAVKEKAAELIARLKD